MKDEKKDEEIQGITGIKLDDQKKRNNTAKTIENAVKISEKPTGVAIFVDGKELKEGETISGHLDDHKKHVEANMKMEEKLKLDPPKETLKDYQERMKGEIERESRVKMKRIRSPQLPKKLIILSVEWDISYFDRQIEVDEDRNERLFGSINYEKNTIRIFRGGRKKECIFQTIFHEWLHIVMTHFGYKEDLGDKEECFIEATSTSLNDLFWRNFRC